MGGIWSRTQILLRNCVICGVAPYSVMDMAADSDHQICKECWEKLERCDWCGNPTEHPFQLDEETTLCEACAPCDVR
jgi:hypothetical protein